MEEALAPRLQAVRIERDREWTAWLERREQIIADGLSFNELPPAVCPSTSRPSPTPPSLAALEYLPLSEFHASFDRYAKKRFEEGRATARIERDTEWAAWFERRDHALADDKPFDEPPPSAKASRNGA